MKFYIENQNEEKVYEGTQDECTKEIDRLINSDEYGYWFMFDETDPNEPWQEGGLSEVKEKIDDRRYWEENYPYDVMSAQQLRALDARRAEAHEGEVITAVRQ